MLSRRGGKNRRYKKRDFASTRNNSNNNKKNNNNDPMTLDDNDNSNNNNGGSSTEDGECYTYITSNYEQRTSSSNDKYPKPLNVRVLFVLPSSYKKRDSTARKATSLFLLVSSNFPISSSCQKLSCLGKDVPHFQEPEAN